MVLLLKSGANIHSKNIQGENSLMVAARSGHVSMAKALIHSGAEIDSRDNLGQTPLMVAIQNNHPRMVDFLIKSKADVNAKNNKGVTPLMLAAINGNILETRTLITAGSKIEMTDRDGRNALSYAQSNHKKNISDFLKRISAVPASRPVGDFPRALPEKRPQSQNAAIPVSP
jgi:ankyrin repeat protein